MIRKSSLHFFISHLTHLSPCCTLLCSCIFLKICLKPLPWNVFLALFQYLPEVLVPYDQFWSYLMNKCRLRERGPGFPTRRVLINAYQAVTSEDESKVRLFSPFPQSPAFHPAGALRRRQIVIEARQNLSNTGQKYQDNIDPTTGQHYSTPMFCVVNTKDMFAKLAALAESIE